VHTGTWADARVDLERRESHLKSTRVEAIYFLVVLSSSSLYSIGVGRGALGRWNEVWNRGNEVISIFCIIIPVYRGIRAKHTMNI
jgi:hypothetical protein